MLFEELRFGLLRLLCSNRHFYGTSFIFLFEHFNDFFLIFFENLFSGLLFLSQILSIVLNFNKIIEIFVMISKSDQNLLKIWLKFGQNCTKLSQIINLHNLRLAFFAISIKLPSNITNFKPLFINFNKSFKMIRI